MVVEFISVNIPHIPWSTFVVRLSCSFVRCYLEKCLGVPILSLGNPCKRGATLTPLQMGKNLSFLTPLTSYHHTLCIMEMLRATFSTASKTDRDCSLSKTIF